MNTHQQYIDIALRAREVAYVTDTLAPIWVEHVARDVADNHAYGAADTFHAILDALTERHLEALKLDAFTRGEAFARRIAAYNVPGESDCADLTIDDARELHQEYCGEALENAMCYSPFESTAREFNSSPASDELWAAFNAGAWETMARDVDATPAAAYGLAE